MIKNNAEFFSHDGSMRNDRSILALRNKFGITGYAIWSMLLEEFCISDNFRIEYDDIAIETLAGDFRIESELLQQIIEYMLKLKLIFLVDGYLLSHNFIARMRPLEEKRLAKSEAGKKGMSNRYNKAEAVSSETNSVITETNSVITETNSVITADNIVEYSIVEYSKDEDEERTRASSSLFQKLKESGLSENQAQDVIAKKPDSYLQSKLDLLEWLSIHKPHKIKNRASWLYSAITRDWIDDEFDNRNAISNPHVKKPDRTEKKIRSVIAKYAELTGIEPEYDVIKAAYQKCEIKDHELLRVILDDMNYFEPQILHETHLESILANPELLRKTRNRSLNTPIAINFKAKQQEGLLCQTG